jgi:hypothetical protein
MGYHGRHDIHKRGTTYSYPKFLFGNMKNLILNNSQLSYSQSPLSNPIKLEES